MHRPIAINQQIAFQQIVMLDQSFLQMRRAGFFFAIEHNFHIHAEGNFSARNASIDGKQRDDRRFIIGRRARVESPIILVFPYGNEMICPGSSGLSRSVGSNGFVPSTCWIDGLPVVVHVENNRALRIGRFQFPEHNRAATFDFAETAFKIRGRAASPPASRRCAKFLRVTRDIGNRQQRDHLVITRASLASRHARTSAQLARNSAEPFAAQPKRRSKVQTAKAIQFEIYSRSSPVTVSTPNHKYHNECAANLI